jgi:hypothetical protein
MYFRGLAVGCALSCAACTDVGSPKHSVPATGLIENRVRKIVPLSNVDLNAASRALLASPQANPSSPSIPVRRPAVTVALVDELPVLADHKTYQAVILRRPSSIEKDIILLKRSSSSPAALDAAVRTLLSVRIRYGAHPRPIQQGRRTTEMEIGVNPSAAPARWESAYSDRSGKVYADLLLAKPSHVTGVGTVPAIRFTPPLPLSRVGGTK